MANTINDLYLKYVNRVGKTLENDRYFQYLFEMAQAGKTNLQQKNVVLHKAVDERWLTIIEDSLDAINTIIENPRRFVTTKEEVVPVGLAKKITADSVRHLSQNTQFIASSEDGDIQPTRILNVSTEETYDLYENRFIYHLIQRLVTFIDKRTDVIFWSTGDETEHDLHMDCNVDDAYEQITYSIDMKIKNRQNILENDTDHMSVFMRIDRVRRLVMALRQSSFCQIMAGCAKVRSPIQRTNLIMKDPNYRTCYKLWQFLESYDEVGYTIEAQDSTLEFDEEYLVQMYTNFIANYTVFKTLLETDARKIEEAPARHRKTVKPKFIKQVQELVVDNRDLPDVEIRRVFVEEVTQAQLDAEAALAEERAKNEELEQTNAELQGQLFEAQRQSSEAMTAMLDAQDQAEAAMQAKQAAEEAQSAAEAARIRAEEQTAQANAAQAAAETAAAEAREAREEAEAAAAQAEEKRQQAEAAAAAAAAAREQTRQEAEAQQQAMERQLEQQKAEAQRQAAQEAETRQQAMERQLEQQKAEAEQARQQAVAAARQEEQAQAAQARQTLNEQFAAERAKLDTQHKKEQKQLTQRYLSERQKMEQEYKAERQQTAAAQAAWERDRRNEQKAAALRQAQLEQQRQAERQQAEDARQKLINDGNARQAEADAKLTALQQAYDRLQQTLRENAEQYEATLKREREQSAAALEKARQARAEAERQAREESVLRGKVEERAGAASLTEFVRASYAERRERRRQASQNRKTDQ